MAPTVTTPPSTSPHCLPRKRSRLSGVPHVSTNKALSPGTKADEYKRALRGKRVGVRKTDADTIKMFDYVERTCRGKRTSARLMEVASP